MRLHEKIAKLLKVDETTALKVEDYIAKFYDLDYSEITMRAFNKSVREAYAEMKEKGDL